MSEKTQLEMLVERARQYACGGTASHRSSLWLASGELGLEGEERISLCNLASNIIVLDSDYVGGTIPQEKTERESLMLRGKDRIEGDNVVLVFKKKRELVFSKDKWVEMIRRHPEPHAVAALQLEEV